MNGGNLLTEFMYRFKKDPLRIKEPYNKSGLADYRREQRLEKNQTERKQFMNSLPRGQTRIRRSNDRRLVDKILNDLSKNYKLTTALHC